jgi:hypothetical protein
MVFPDKEMKQQFQIVTPLFLRFQREIGLILRNNQIKIK